MSDFHQRFAARAAALLMAGGLVAGCSSTSPEKIDYRSDSKGKQSTLAVPPNFVDEVPDQRSVPPQNGQATLSAFEQAKTTAPKDDDSVPAADGMHIQRDGTESWLVIDHRSPESVWAQVRRFWQEQGFLLVVDQRDKGVMETDWNETHPKVSDGLIRNTLSWATGNSYVTAERNKFRTRLEIAPNGGTYVFISQKGLRQALSGNNNESSKWVPRQSDPTLEAEYLKRLMTTLARAQPGVPDAQIAAAADAAAKKGGKGEKGGDASAAPDMAATIAQNVAIAQGSPTGGDDASSKSTFSSGLALPMSYDNAWQQVGFALNRANFTVASSDHTSGIYTINYVDPKDHSSENQGFWSQLFHGHKEKEAQAYRVNVRALTNVQTQVAVVDDKGNVDTSRPAQEIMSLLAEQLR